MKKTQHKLKSYYSDIMDINQEFNLYVALCKSKWKPERKICYFFKSLIKKKEIPKYYYYSEWRSHIEESLMQIHSTKRLADFKAFLKNKKRDARSVKGVSATVLVLLITLYAESAIPQFLEELQVLSLDSSVAKFVVKFIAAIFGLWITVKLTKELICSNISENRYYNFYSDILEILEEKETIILNKIMMNDSK